MTKPNKKNYCEGNTKKCDTVNTNYTRSIQQTAGKKLLHII
jgi:hypothetical protein